MQNGTSSPSAHDLWSSHILKEYLIASFKQMEFVVFFFF